MVWSNITQSEWDMPNYYDPMEWIPRKVDALLIGGLAVLFTILRVVVQKFFLWVRLFHFWRLISALQHAKVSKIQEARKYAESCWKAIFYSTVWAWGLYIVYHCEFFPKTILCWQGYPNIPIEPELYYYYLYQLAFYVHSLYAHLVMEVRRSDFWPLLFHHVVTVWLIYFSYMVKFHRIGILVLICHDANDVFFEIGKTFVYRKWEKIQAAWFVLIIISWMVTRLGIYPSMVMYSAWFESSATIPEDVFPFFYGFNYSLMFLLCLHIYWFGLMLRMLVRYIKGEPISDTRETKSKDD